MSITAPRVAIGIGPGDSGLFKIVIRAPSQRELDRALGEGVAEKMYEIAEHEIDVDIIGEIFAGPSISGDPPYVPAAESAPLAIGGSVGHHCCTAGSLGFFAQRLSDSSIGFVSTNHVLAHSDRGKEGDDILYPGPIDSGDRPKRVVAHLVAGYPRLQNNIPIVDAAFARLQDGIIYDASSVGPSMQLQEMLVPLYQQRNVVKFGRSTGFTRGQITAFSLQNLDVYFPWLETTITFNQQIEIKSEGDVPFSRPGDSGSLVMNPDGHPIGLVFAASPDGKYVYANPIADVLRALDIRMLSRPPHL
jgi:hypothetical protein